MLRLRAMPLARAALGAPLLGCSRPRLPRPRLLTSAASPPAEPVAPLTLYQRIMPVGLWSFVALNVGAFFSAGDEGVQVLIHLEEFTGPVLSGGTSRRELTDRLERISRGASQNDTLKLQLLSTPGMAERLLQLLTDEGVSPTARNHAAKVIEYIGSHPEGACQMVERGMHETVRPARARARARARAGRPSPSLSLQPGPEPEPEPEDWALLVRELSPAASACAGAAARAGRRRLALCA